MHKIWVIARREYLAAVRTKSFVVSLVFMPLLMLGSAAVQGLVDDLATSQENRYAVVDRTPDQALFPVLEAFAQTRNERQLLDPISGKQTGPRFLLERVAPSADTPEAIRAQLFDLSERVRQGKLTGLLDIGADVMRMPPPVGERGSVRYLSNSPTNDAFSRWVVVGLNEGIVARRCEAAGVPREKVARLVQPTLVQGKGLFKRDPATDAIVETSDSGRAVHTLVPIGLAGLMFMVIMVGAAPLLHGMIEEKTQRIAEVLLGSVRPFQLMMGKLLGMMGVSLTLAAVYLGGAYSALDRWGYAEYMPAELLVWFVLYQSLAVLMFGSLFIAIGAACTDAKESQTLLMPVMIVIMLPIMALRHIVQEPNSAFSTWASFVPFATPMLMMPRIGLPPGAPWWQPPLGVLGVLLTTLVCVYAAGRIFRVGILMQGKGARLSDLARWVIRG